MPPAETLIRRYDDTFNAGDEAGFLALLAEDVVHDINQGGREVGREAFARFLSRMNGIVSARARPGGRDGRALPAYAACRIASAMAARRCCSRRRRLAGMRWL